MASGRRASEHLVLKQQREVEDTDDSAVNDDDLMPTAFTTQSDQSSQSEVTSMMVTVCTEDMKGLYITPSSPHYRWITTRINICSSHPSNNESMPADVTLSDDDCSGAEQRKAGNIDKREDPTIKHCQPDPPSLGATKRPEATPLSTGTYQNDATPSCMLNQKERKLSPSSTSIPQHHIGTNHLMPALIDHPWILPFPCYSTIDHHNVQPLFAAEDNDLGGIGCQPMGSHGLECQICCDGSVECAFKPCGHARTCRSCSDHFLHRPCPFCRQPVQLAYRIHL